MQAGQTILIQKPDNLPTGGQESEKRRRTALSRGTIAGIYEHVVIVQFDNYKNGYRIEDLRLGLEPYKEVANG